MSGGDPAACIDAELDNDDAPLGTAPVQKKPAIRKMRQTVVDADDVAADVLMTPDPSAPNVSQAAAVGPAAPAPPTTSCSGAPRRRSPRGHRRGRGSREGQVIMMTDVMSHL